jgi:hypothetical protein
MLKKMADKNCPKCRGYGFTITEEVYMGSPVTVQCVCMLKLQCERAWKDLSVVPVDRKSPMIGKMKENLRIVANQTDLATHLRTAILSERNPTLNIRVVSDATLISAWLSNVSDDNKVDPDLIRDINVRGLEDLAEAPDLLIVRLGVKRARNSATSEVLIETIELRQHLNKATWIVEEPSKPLQEGHLAWSSALEDTLSGWKIYNVTGSDSFATAKKKPNLSLDFKKAQL